MNKENIIKQLTSIDGIGKAKAEALYNSGFTSIDKIKGASVEDIAKVKGINKTLAEKIKEHFSTVKEKKEAVEQINKPKEVESEEKPEKKEEPKEGEKSQEEEKVKEYHSKQKPKIEKNRKIALALRKIKKRKEPEFLRQEWFRYKRIKPKWRKPKGLHSKYRKNLRYRPKLVRIGFRGPRNARGLHPSGFEEILVYNPDDLDNLDPSTQAIRIGSTVGTRKRVMIKKKAEKIGIRILNRGEL